MVSGLCYFYMAFNNVVDGLLSVVYHVSKVGEELVDGIRDEVRSGAVLALVLTVQVRVPGVTVLVLIILRKQEKIKNSSNNKFYNKHDILTCRSRYFMSNLKIKDRVVLPLPIALHLCLEIKDSFGSLNLLTSS